MISLLKEQLKIELNRQLLLLKGGASTDEFEDPEADVKFVFGSEWENSSMLF